MTPNSIHDLLIADLNSYTNSKVVNTRKLDSKEARTISWFAATPSLIYTWVSTRRPPICFLVEVDDGKTSVSVYSDPLKTSSIDPLLINFVVYNTIPETMRVDAIVSTLRNLESILVSAMDIREKANEFYKRNIQIKSRYEGKIVSRFDAKRADYHLIWNPDEKPFSFSILMDGSIVCGDKEIIPSMERLLARLDDLVATPVDSVSD